MRAYFIFFGLLCSLLAQGQCGACNYSDTCTVDPPFPTVCPMITPVGRVGVPYSVDLTLWIPASFPEPNTQLNVVLQEVVGNTIENVPLGLGYSSSSPNFTFYPQQNEFACVRVCGTPLAPMQDSIRIVATATGTVGGVNTSRSYTIPIPVVILPADSVNHGFTAPPDTACAPFVFDPQPLIDAPGYTVVNSWDFGNGNTFTGDDPPAQTCGAGQHVIELTTTASAPVLTQLSVSGVNDNWCGDLDEPNLFICVGEPDLYFVIVDAQLGAYRSSVASNTESHTWSGITFPLIHPPFTVRVYDEDGLTDDDLLGTFTIGNGTGNTPFSGGGTSGQATAQVQALATLHNTDTLNVQPPPNTSLLFNQMTSLLCAADLGLTSYVWELNGEVVNGANGPCVIGTNGFWSVTGTNGFGCSSTSTLDLLSLGINTPASCSAEVGPVPSDGVFNVRLRGWPASVIDVAVYDARGAVVHSGRAGVSNGAFVLDLASLAGGRYMLFLQDDAHRVMRPLVIEAH